MKLTTAFIKEGAKMKNPILTVLFVVMLFASLMLVLPARAQNGIPTTAILAIAPNPVGLGQQILGIMWIQADPMPGEAFYDLTVEVHKPDDSMETLGPFDTNNDGVGYFQYIVTSIGTYKFTLHFPGNKFGEYPVIEYLPSDSDVYDLVVQEDPVGQIVVPEGDDVEVSPDPKVTLIFDLVKVPGLLQLDKSMTGPPPDVGSLIGPYYYITTTAEFEGNIIVKINYDEPEGMDESLLRMIQTDIVPGDVNLDGIVNWGDLIIISRAVRSYLSHRRWNPSCDLNKDNKVNWRDLCIAQENYGKRSLWTDITDHVDTTNNIIQGITDHLDDLDPFGVR